MERRFAFAFAALTVLAASSSALGCSSADDETPPAYPMGEDGDVDEATELRALEIGNDEPIVDEGNVDEGRDGVLEENPIADDEEEVGDVQLLTVAPRTEPRVLITAHKYKCPGHYAGSCVCEGSPLNCELPNDQPGRNRYLPASFVAEVQRRGGSFSELVDAGRWELAPGTALHDGEGKVRGTFKSTCLSFAGPTGTALVKDDSKVCAKINFGQIKNIKADGDTAPHTFVYAFNVYVNGVVDSSGWIRLDSVVQKADLAKMGSHAPRRIRSFVATKYVVKSARDWGQDPATFVSDKLPSWAQDKVAPGSGSKKVRDYLLRDGNVINLAYATPGVGGAATDTFLVADHGLAFRRVKSTERRPTLVRIPVDGVKKKGMVFAYGSVNGRFGWIALAAIKQGSIAAAPLPAPAASLCGDKADGTYCSDQFPLYGYICRSGKVVTALECQAGATKCTGPAADGASLVCDL
ncbi:MAG: hypothetical protein JWP87_1283 [Labilithrix sp.]|nr:hypothetical protein [Labilithrix sp.]